MVVYPWIIFRDPDIVSVEVPDDKKVNHRQALLGICPMPEDITSWMSISFILDAAD